MAKLPLRKPRPSRIVIILIPIVFGIVLFIVERHISDDSASMLHIFLQFATTTWPAAHTQYDRTTVWFAAAVAVRIAVADSLLAGIWMTFANLSVWNQQQTVKYADALRLRDHAIEEEMLKMFPAEEIDQRRESMRKAFEDASRTWEHEHLPSTLGPDLAREFIKHLHDQPIGE
ncbi:MAG TPA: hypothetical protein VMT64_14725 [Candidatus Binataceae bacterium]|nr:hypothetical protein [Candidatus Binataceae bacterium]